MTRATANGGTAASRLPAIFLLGPLVAGAVWLAPRALHWMEGDVAAAPTPAAVAAASGAGTPGVGAVPAPQTRAAPAALTPQPQALQPRWEADVHSRDPAARADALAGLATAPRDRALPILQNLLKDGAYPDRQLVIESLAIMARLQGDADERIRTAFRVEIYDGSDEATTASAQRALADLEEDLR